ncbi:acyl-CoA synthetase (AMP-forming)/AMP-acid ligase II [Aeromicrobium panaciterrae]|uniref:Acyl-CoA synthetase (AMP-forming)/AMP-acid ligase II n=1 Tax=Aeromicrobium panaciterrae TaxID=363861 RepID=A0ABU1UMC2_9ACTN|nr:acyl-CoA synthetase [Aeromicrobium panaciterrae]MDR7086326.1 acyl-CoA synthetase (AMP-forming)/AMP-acid ligase II [Aeromicrobium panaciterrae]
MTTEFNIGLAHELLGEALADNEVLVFRDRRLTYADLASRSRRLATYLHRAGLGAHTERADLANHESGQDHVALYLHNGTEYLEGMLGCFKSRCASINVNYRYVGEELRYLFGNANARAVIYHGTFAPKLAAVLDALPNLEVLLQVDDGSGNELLPGAVDYEEALASVPDEMPDVQHSPDDLFILYTGGTTGMPKGVLWRQHDIFMSAMGGQVPGVWDAISTYDEFVERAVAGAASNGTMVMVPPFMHGAAQWSSFIMMAGGTKIVIPNENTHMDAADILRTIDRESAATITVVGDAVVRPLLDEIKTGRYDLSSLVIIGNGSAALSPELKEQVLEELPNIFINDSMGASETGAQASHLSAKGNVSTGKFAVGPGAVVVNEDLTALLEPGHDGIGWLGQAGWVPLGYFGDAEKTAKTFPMINGTRYAVPGDRARLLANGEVEVLGRESATINTGGEKVFAEEVEAAITSHADVRDVLVVGRPHERWGKEVVAVIELEEGAEISDDELAEHAGERIARYKIPKGWVYVPKIVRSPSGKADYRWAHTVAEEDAK